MSMFDDVLGLGRSSVMESMTVDTFEPEIAGMTLEEAEMLDESTDPMDFILKVAYENEMNMMRLDAAIIAEEYLYLRENGEEMVTEAGKIESVIAKFKKGVQWLWGKIQSFFKTVMNKIDKALKLDERFLTKYEKKAAGKTAMVKGNQRLLDISEIGNDAADVMDKIGKLSEAMFDQLSHDVNPDPKKAIDNINKTLGAKIVGEGDGEETTKEILKAIIKGYKPGEDAKPESVSADKAIAAFKASKGVKADIKKCYDKNKKAINAQLKAAKKMETAAKKFKVLPTETSKAIHASVKLLNKLGTILTQTNRSYVSIVNKSRSYCKAVIVTAAAKAVDQPKATGESASIIDSLEFGFTL